MRVRRRNPNAALCATSSANPIKTLVVGKDSQGLQLRMERSFKDIEIEFWQADRARPSEFNC